MYVYFIDGLLIDTGQVKMREAVLNKTRNLPITQIFVTHHHEDHSGNAEALEKILGCPVYGSRLCQETMLNPPEISLPQKLFWGDRPAFTGIIPVEKELKTKKYSFQLIPIPGHAHDMVALFEPEQKWLFSADLYLSSRISYFLYSENIQQQIESISKVLQLDFDALFCAHRPVLKNGKEQLKRKLDYLEEFVDIVLRLHQEGKSIRGIMRGLPVKETWLVRLLSSGDLSLRNMALSVLRDFEQKT